MKTEIRNYDENVEFVDLIDSAIDKAEQAISQISYLSYPDVNRYTIETIRNAISMLEDASAATIQKPIR